MNIFLTKFEYIRYVRPEVGSGPGWSNRVVFVGVYNTLDGTTREEGIQEEDFTPELTALFCVGAAVHEELHIAVSKYAREVK